MTCDDDHGWEYDEIGGGGSPPRPTPIVERPAATDDDAWEYNEIGGREAPLT